MEAVKRLAYYQTTTKIELPEHPQWRFWKFKLADGTWKLIRGIKDLRELRDKLVKYNPEAFYYSTSEFLNVDKIENPEYMVADQLFLFNQYFIVDIDNEFGTGDVVKVAYEVMEKMKNYSHMYKFEKPVFTGRGVRLEFRDLVEKPNLLPHQKELWVKETRKQFCLENLEIPTVDHVIAWDTRRVVKCIGSPNPYNEYTTQVIKSPAYIPAMPGKAELKARLANETNGKVSDFSLHEQGRATEQESGNSPYPLYFGKFIRNKVEGTKDRFVVYFEYQKDDMWQKDLKFLQEKYGLSTIYVVDDFMRVLCVGIDAIPKEHLDKIYQESKAKNKTTWDKFKNLYIRTSAYFNSNLKHLKEYDLKPLFKIDNSAHKLYPLSKPHIDFINHIGFNTDSLIVMPNSIGKDRNTIYEAFFENRRMDKW